jgi:transposase
VVAPAAEARVAAVCRRSWTRSPSSPTCRTAGSHTSRRKLVRADAFKFSTDPQLAAKVHDVVGLYLHPPERAVVLCVGEESQIQALERTQRSARSGPGAPSSAPTTLFAALEVATGHIIDRCTPRHRHQEFLAFLKQVARAYPRRQLHVICDNYATHKHPKVRAWLARHPRVRLHFTPTSASWLNLVEVFSSIVERQALRRGDFVSVTDLTAAISRFCAAWNQHCQPFAWTKHADEILAKLNRQTTSATEHSAMLACRWPHGRPRLGKLT